MAKRRATIEDLAAERDRGLAVELIDGELVPKATPLPAHGGAQMKLGELLGGFHPQAGKPRGPGGWWIMSEVEIAYPRTDEVFRHDVLGFRRDAHPARPDGMPVRARPDCRPRRAVRGGGDLDLRSLRPRLTRPRGGQAFSPRSR